jgi:hypothetical protein
VLIHVESLQKALDLDLEYVQLQHMCLVSQFHFANHDQTDLNSGIMLAITLCLATGKVLWIASVSSKTSPTGVEPSTPSAYTAYPLCIFCTDISSAAAASLVELVEDDHPGATREEAQRLMEEIPKLTKKIAGKSLPIEKLCSRKARKFHSQENRLFLPAMELAYVFGSRIDRMLGKLEASEPEAHGNGHEYWDGEFPYQRWDGRR